MLETKTSYSQSSIFSPASATLYPSLNLTTKTYRTTTLPAVCYECETLYLTLSEESRLRMLGEEGFKEKIT
jgi:hypothetical protein